MWAGKEAHRYHPGRERQRWGGRDEGKKWCLGSEGVVHRNLLLGPQTSSL